MSLAVASRAAGRAAHRSDAGGEQRRFVAYAAHELRTPLTTQRTLLELALADRDADVACWREIGQGVLDACKQQERLVEACLTLARSQSGAQRREPLDLATLAADALAARDLRELDLVLALEPVSTIGDPELLERLVSNLISNAIRHNLAGGRIEVATRARSGHAHLAVANTGRPVPVADLSRLFQPFQRLAPDGVGLGLAIVQAIADAHDATVSARARSGGGLRIDVSFRPLD
jgi:signal transduction histidine kinase